MSNFSWNTFDVDSVYGMSKTFNLVKGIPTEITLFLQKASLSSWLQQSRYRFCLLQICGYFHQSAQIAVDFTAAAILRTKNAGTDIRFGVNFEQEIPSFLKALKLV